MSSWPPTGRLPAVICTPRNWMIISRLLKNYFEPARWGRWNWAWWPIGGARRVFKKTVQRGTRDDE